MIKRLAIRKLTDGEHAGHHGIFDGDDLVGYMTDEDFAKYAERHLPASPGEPGETAALSEGFAERVGGAGLGPERIRALVEAGQRAEAEARETQSRALVLSEAVHAGRVDHERALSLARSERIRLEDYIAVEAAEKALDRAVELGKILPRDRQFFFRDALERPQEFAEFMERAAPVLRFGSVGLGSGEPVPVDQEVDLEVKRLMSEQRLSYGKALRQLFRENPGLEARYRAAHTRPSGPEGAENPMTQ